MTPERWQRVKRLFAAARERTPTERDSWLAQQCADDPGLRTEVSELLAEHEADREFLSDSILRAVAGTTVGARAAAPAQPDEPPEFVGRYRLLRVLGDGGMGTVYLAEQENPRRTVALKVLRAGITSPDAVRRFEHEAQILARLQHPGIAQVYEAGTADAGRRPRPFFAMELVSGPSLTEYAAGRGLSLRERLELFLKVCDAVQYAHQRGIIHRDLKPANILVAEPQPAPTAGGEDAAPRAALDGGAPPAGPRATADARGGDGQPKVLDFGVARVTDADVQPTTRQTDLVQLVGTIPYMSPEQVRGDPRELDTRADVYALGVVLYELLTGRCPFDVAGKTLPEALRVVVEVDPPPLRSLRPTLPRDLEAIVAKALEKDPARRYQSAIELALDIQRHFHHEPVSARPVTTFYRVRTFARRNLATVTAVAAVFAALLLGLLAATVERNRARQAERKAESRRADAERRRIAAEEVTALLQSMLGAADPHKTKGPHYTVRQLLDDFAGGLNDRLADQPDVESAIRATIGNAYRRLGLYDRAAEHLSAALDLRRRTLPPQHPLVAQSLYDRGWVLHDLAEYPASADAFRAALDIRRRLFGNEDAQVAACLTALADVLRHQADYVDAERLAREALAVRRRLLGPAHRDTAESLIYLSRVLRDAGDDEAPEPLIREAVDIYRAAHGGAHPDVADALNDLGWLYYLRREYPAAEQALREALDMGMRLLGPEHPDTATSLYELGMVLQARAQPAEAETCLRAALAVYRSVHGNDHPAVVTTLSGLASVLRGRGDYDAAEPLLREALEARRRVLGEDHPEVAMSLGDLAGLMRDKGDLEAAERFLREQLALHRRIFAGDHARVATSLAQLAGLLRDRRDFDAAESLHTEALEMRRRLFGSQHVEVARSLMGLATLRTAARRDAEAEPRFRDAAAMFEATRGAGHPETAVCRSLLGDCLTRLGRFEEAEAQLVPAHEALRTALGPEHPTTRASAGRLVRLYTDWNRPEQADVYRAARPP